MKKLISLILLAFIASQMWAYTCSATVSGTGGTITLKYSSSNTPSFYSSTTNNTISTTTAYHFQVTITPNANYQVATFTANGTDKKSKLSNNVYSTYTSGDGKVSSDMIYTVAFESTGGGGGNDDNPADKTGVTYKVDGSGSYTMNAYYMGTGDGIIWGDRALGSGSNAYSEGKYFQYGSTTSTTNASTSYTYDKNILTNSKNLPADKDAATACLGKGWRMPTQTEAAQLISSASSISRTDAQAYVTLVSNNNNKTIYFYVGGDYNGDTHEKYGSGDSKYAFYWTSSFNSSYSANDYYRITFKTDNWSSTKGYLSTKSATEHAIEYYGYQVKPVYDYSDNYTITIKGGTAGTTTLRTKQSQWGDSAKCTAPNITGYRFEKWNDGNTDNPRIFKVCDITYTASYVRQYTVTVSATTNGTITVKNGTTTILTSQSGQSVSTTVDTGTSLTVTAVGATNYEFDEWASGTPTLTNNSFTLNGNVNIGATFKQSVVNHTVSYFLDKNDANATASETIQDGISLTFPSNIQTLLQARFGNKKYSNLVWKNKTGDAEVTTSTTVTADMNCYVEFDTSVDLTLGAFTGGTVTLDAGSDPIVATEGGVLNFAENTAVILTAIPAQGYHFVKWNENNETDVEYRINPLSENTTLTPVFEANKTCTLDDTKSLAVLNDTITGREGQTLTITLKDRSFSTGAWATLSLPFDYNLTDGEALYNSVYAFRRVMLSQDGGSVYLSFVRSNDIAANEPYLVVPRQDVNNPVFNAVTLKAAQSVSHSTDNKVQFVSNLGQQDIHGPNDFYVGANSNLYYAKGTGTTIKGFRSFFRKIGEAASAPRRVRIVLDGVEVEKEIAEDGTIEDVREVRKYMENGRLVIECNGVRMDATGKKIN